MMQQRSDIEPKGFGSFIKEHWNYFAAVGVVLTAIVGAFLLPPPASMTDQTQWFQFGRFSIALIAGLWFVPVVLLSSRRTTWIWWIISILLIAVGCGMFFRYVDFRARWTVSYPILTTNKVVVGEKMQPRAQRLVDSLEHVEQRELSDAEILWGAAGNVAAIWYPEDVRRREQHLVMLYLGSLALLASAVITIVQASYCVSRSDRDGRKPSNAEDTLNSDPERDAQRNPERDAQRNTE